LALKTKIDIMLNLFSTPINTGFRASFGSKKATFQSKVGIAKCINPVFMRFNRIRRGVENRLRHSYIQNLSLVVSVAIFCIGVRLFYPLGNLWIFCAATGNMLPEGSQDDPE